MEEKIAFTRNYQDLSSNKGFQFEFMCDHCGAKLTPKAKFCPECGEKTV